MKKRSICIIFICAILVCISVFIIRHKYNEPSNWNYSGKAVILTRNRGHEFVGTTDLLLEGEIYGFENYFVGDLDISAINQKVSFYPEISPTKGMMTEYRYYRNAGDEKKLEDNKYFAVKIEPAQLWARSKIIPNVRMLQFKWLEWFGGKVDFDNTIDGRLYFEEAKTDFFVVDTMDYLIVPGVLTRAGALAVLHENFSCLDYGGMGFEYYYRHYPYPSTFDENLTLEQQLTNCRIPEETLSEMTVEQLVWAVIDFPFLQECKELSTAEEKIAMLEQSSDAFKKLVSLEQPEGEMIAALMKIWETNETYLSFSNCMPHSIIIGYEVTEGIETFMDVEFVKNIFFHSHGKCFEFDDEALEFLSKNKDWFDDL